MARNARDEEREERINMEIIVDAYGPEGQQEDRLTFFPTPMRA